MSTDDKGHRVPVEPLDPDSETGRQVAAALTRLLLDIDERLAREAATRRLEQKGD